MESATAAATPHVDVCTERLDRARAFTAKVAWLLPILMQVHAAWGAGEIGSDQKYIEAVKKATDITPVATDTFGDRIDLAEGAGSFQWTDIDIPGNNALPVRLQRQLTVEDKSRGSGDLGGFGIAGSLDVPYLKGIHSEEHGWIVDGASPGARCTRFAEGPKTFSAIQPKDYWSGNQLHVPWAGTQQMLASPHVALPRLAGSAAIITKNFWAFECLDKTRNGVPGEAFVGVSPSGERYYFDWVVRRDHAALKKMYGTYGATANLKRDAVYFLVSRIEDRFGNWVTYDYVGDKLKEIRSSDGRFIRIDSWSGNDIAAVSSSIGTRTYTYTPTTMVMGLPDGSRWSYAQTGGLITLATPDRPVYDPTPHCSPFESSLGEYGLTVTQPSGASATFAFEVQRHWISNVAESCSVFSDGRGIGYKFLAQPNYHDTFTLTTKTVQGVGVAPMTWRYSYSGGGNLRSFYAECQDPDALPTVCPRTSTTVVRGPDRSYKRYEHGSMYDENMGQLLRAEEGYESGTAPNIQVNILKTVTHTHLTNTELGWQPFPRWVGVTQSAFIDRSTSSQLRPILETKTTLQGVTFSKRVTKFDGLGRQITGTNSSTLGYSRAEATEYYDDFSLWVFGQTRKQFVANTEVERTDFHAGTALPWKTYQFGKLKQTLTYHADGTVASVSDGRDGVGGVNTTVSLLGWKRGIPQTIRYPATPESPSGALQSAEVSDDGTIASVTQETGAKTCYAYDPVGRLIRITHPSEVAGEEAVCNSKSWEPTLQSFAPAAAEYGLAANHWKQTVIIGASTKVVHFDALWRPVVEESYDNTSATTKGATRRLVVKRYDALGRLAFQSYPLSTLGTYTDAALPGTTTTYDALDRPVRAVQDSELGGLVTITDYLTGFKTRVINPRGYATTTSYEAYEQPTTDYPVAIVNPAGVATVIDRNAFGKPESITRAGLARRYTYDAYQQLCRVVEPETGATLMDYDAAGNLAWSSPGLPSSLPCGSADPSVAVHRASRVYDARNRLTNLQFSDHNGNQFWTYHPDGQVSTITTANEENGSRYNVSNTYMYNRRRLLVGEAINQAEGIRAVGYGYNRLGHLASLTQPNAEVLSFLPNALGQATQVQGDSSYATGATYFPNGALKRFVYGNGIVHTLTQNARGLPMRSLDADSATSVLDDTYLYDANGNVDAILDGLAGNRGNREMTYDNLDRLIRADSPMFGHPAGHAAVYTYDALDNITRLFINSTSTVPGRDHYYCYDANNRLTNLKLTSCSGATVSGLGYDEQGNLKNKDGRDFDFDYGNRLRKAETLAGLTEHYRYDGHGRRVLVKSPDGKDIRSVYGNDGVLRWQEDKRQGKATNYIYLAGSMVAVREKPLAGGSALVKYQHTDALGSPIAETNSAKQLVGARQEYEPYGKVLAPLPASDGPGFTGHVLDASTGLSYMQQRYYDPQTGRFLSVDPVSASGGNGENFNRYWYANNNPFRFKDPDGRCSTGTLICSREVMKRALPIDRNSESDSFPAPSFWPVPGHMTLNRADKPREGKGEFGTRRVSSGGQSTHSGIDIQAPEGAEVVAVSDGLVVDIQPNPSETYGNQIVIRHSDGTYTQYAHLRTISVAPGTYVRGGGAIGTVGRTGNTPPLGDIHLHHERRIGGPEARRQGGTVVDPLPYLPGY